MTTEPAVFPVDPQTVRDTVADLVTDLMYYDRTEDEDLPLGFIEDAINAGALTVDQLAGWFRDALTGYLA